MAAGPAYPQSDICIDALYSVFERSVFGQFGNDKGISVQLSSEEQSERDSGDNEKWMARYRSCLNFASFVSRSNKIHDDESNNYYHEMSHDTLKYPHTPKIWRV
jgi:hypothetical protein